MSDNGLIERSGYTYDGFYEFVEEIRKLNGDVTSVYDLVKRYHAEPWLGGGLVNSFGTHVSTDAQFRYNFIHEAFDGEKFGQFRNSESHHSDYLYNYDNHVEFEYWLDYLAENLRLHDSLLLGGSLGPISHQAATLVGPQYVYRNVIYGFDDHGFTSWTQIKSKVTNPIVRRFTTTTTRFGVAASLPNEWGLVVRGSFFGITGLPPVWLTLLNKLGEYRLWERNIRKSSVPTSWP